MHKLNQKNKKITDKIKSENKSQMKFYYNLSV